MGLNSGVYATDSIDTGEQETGSVADKSSLLEENCIIHIGIPGDEFKV